MTVRIALPKESYDPGDLIVPLSGRKIYRVQPNGERRKVLFEELTRQEQDMVALVEQERDWGRASSKAAKRMDGPQTT